MGSLHEKSIVKIDSTMALICLLINCCFLPGLGTIIAAALSENKPMEGFVVGIIQIFTFELIFGWIWAIITGCKIYSKSK